MYKIKIFFLMALLQLAISYHNEFLINLVESEKSYNFESKWDPSLASLMVENIFQLYFKC